MSLHSYQQSLQISAGKAIPVGTPQFSALIISAMRQADTDNMMRLENAFPEIATELRQRYNAPGGIIRGDE